MSTRVERVAEEVRAALASALLRDVQDPKLALVSINAVKMAPDLGHARVYWALVAPEVNPAAVAAAGKALDRAAGLLRRHVGQAVRLRVVPNLDFVYDESVERGRRLSALIDSLDIPDEDE